MVIVFLAVLSSGIALNHSSLTLTIIDTKENFYFADEKFDPDSARLFIANCRDHQGDELHLHHSCDIVVHSLPLNLSQSPTRKCPNINLVENSTTITGLPIHGIHFQSFNDDVAVIKWEKVLCESNIIFITIVNVTSCSVTRLQSRHDLNINQMMENVSGHGPNFGVFSEDKKLCEVEKFRLKDKLLDQANLSSTSGIVELTSVEDTKGDIVVRFDEHNLKLTFKRNMHDDSGLHVFPNNKFRYVAMSKTNGKFGLCSALRSNQTRCAQYDAEGRMKINASLKLESNEVPMVVYNLIGDTMLMLSSNCSEEVSGTYRCKNFLITKIEVNGQRKSWSHIDSIPGEEFTCNFNQGVVRADGFEVDDKVCFYLKCFHKKILEDKINAEHFIDFRSVCVPKAFM
ncbi:hypothetical protein QAD02_006543 [Eretmocerus hayati]|uniref:Uncharacterized protein n=1 Tax=Eretmocerus hayati TaxID=131215 RepID=A0ACC2N1I7_9HYME|nr:hypothetical protein QAD02_006543 [Eretmocerus hayati]